MDCGRSFPHYVMDLDHVRGVKRCDVANMVQRAVPTAVFLDEIAKCDVVCANCHRIRTHAGGESRVAKASPRKEAEPLPLFEPVS